MMASPQFTPAPPDLAVEFQYDFHLLTNPSYPVIVHPIGNQQLKHYTYSDIVPAIHRAAQSLQIATGYPQETGDQSCVREAPIVAVIATTDSLTYLINILGILRAGMTAFPISPRFSPNIISHLIKDIMPSHILVNEEARHLADEALQHLDVVKAPPVLSMPTYEDLFAPGTSQLLPKHSRGVHEPALIIHSSASTSKFPKTIPWTSSFYLRNSDIIDYSAEPLIGKVFGLQSLELFHSVGLAFLGWVARAGFVMALLNPEDLCSKSPADANTVFKGYTETQPSFIYASTHLLETLATDPIKRNFMKSAIVITGGKVMSKQCGDALVADGIRISMAFGSTETGSVVLVSTPHTKDWEYFCAPEVPEFKFILQEDGLYALTVLSTQHRQLPVCNTEYNGQPAFNTGDLFMAHKVKKNCYCVFGRRSDQIMLATGEMVNPLPIEDAISRNPAVKHVCVFGHARFLIGVIVEPHRGRVKDTVTFLNNLWATISTVNEASSKHCYISEKMIIISEISKPICINAKGAVRRSMTLKEYDSEISALYQCRVKA
ncbi:acetyl-CoA synthetase-like protein [Marasmius fiardii PR-910]|nr:acetyl-CoA synthetase-like protein [Marasmius fiardii PR-910]